MRLDRILITTLAVLVLVLWVRSPVQGPSWPIALATVTAAVFLLLARRTPWPAPPPFPPRPAVLIPTYNNHRSIGSVVERAVALGIPVFVVDDGSTDGSGTLADDAGATVVTHPENRGKGAALLTGMKALAKAGFTHAICLDADGQHHPEDIPAFAEAINADPFVIYAGLRDLSTAPGISRFGRRFSNFWIWVETGWRVADSQCGFRSYPLAPVLALSLGSSRYDMEVEVLTRALWSGVPVHDLPCQVTYPPKTERVTSFRPLVDNARITWVNIKLIAERILWPPYWFPRPGSARARERSRWNATSRGFSLGWRLVFGVLRTVGRRPATLLARAVSAWYVPFAPREGLNRYLRRALPKQSAWMGRATIYGNFAEVLVDRMAWALNGPDEFRYVSEGTECMVDAFTQQRGAILLSAHAGNIECTAGPTRASDRMKSLHVLRFTAAVDHGMAVLSGMDPKWRPRIIPVNRSEGFSALAALRVLREGAVVAMHGDRLIDARYVTVNLLGAPCRMPAGPWLLAALAQVPVIVVGCFKEDGNTFRVVCAPPMECRFDRKRDRDEQIQEWAQRYADQVGAWVERWPLQWYNFHDLWTQEAPAEPRSGGPSKVAGSEDIT